MPSAYSGSIGMPIEPVALFLAHYPQLLCVNKNATKFPKFALTRTAHITHTGLTGNLASFRVDSRQANGRLIETVHPSKNPITTATPQALRTGGCDSGDVYAPMPPTHCMGTISQHAPMDIALLEEWTS